MPAINGPLAARGATGGVLGTGAGGAALRWYDPNGAFAADGGNLYAWRAQNSVGTVWPGGPANYAATLTDQSSGQVATEGNGAIAWAAATGWRFTAALAQWLDTLLIPTNTQTWSVFVQFSNNTNINSARLFGCVSPGGGARSLSIIPYYLAPGASLIYQNGGNVIIAPNLAAGNLGFGGNQGYRNGVADGGLIPIWTQPSIEEIFIGAINNVGVAASFCTAYIQAIWIYDQNAALVQAQAVLADGFRAAMGQL
jgi:hypothetical protein